VIVGNFNIKGPILIIRPLETYPPLLINPDTVLPFPVPAQRLEPIAWQPHQVASIRRGFKQVNSPLCLISEGLEFLYVLASGKAPCALVAISRRSLSASEFVHN
jgi:hypothetical protein